MIIAEPEIILQAVSTRHGFRVAILHGDKEIAQEYFAFSEFVYFIDEMQDPFSVGTVTVVVGETSVLKRFKKYLRRILEGASK